jgi:hypothetical protein
LNVASCASFSDACTVHASGYVIQQRTGEWTPALTVRNPFQNQTDLEPIGRDAETSTAALELAFDEAEKIESRFAQVKAEREHRPATRYDDFTPDEARVEAEYDALVRADRRRLVTYIAVVAAIGALVIWLFLF